VKNFWIIGNVDPSASRYAPRFTSFSLILFWSASWSLEGNLLGAKLEGRNPDWRRQQQGDSSPITQAYLLHSSRSGQQTHTHTQIVDWCRHRFNEVLISDLALTGICHNTEILAALGAQNMQRPTKEKALNVSITRVSVAFYGSIIYRDPVPLPVCGWSFAVVPVRPLYTYYTCLLVLPFKDFTHSSHESSEVGITARAVLQLWSR